MSDNKVSPSQERCWLSNRVQLLETKVTAVDVERDRGGLCYMAL